MFGLGYVGTVTAACLASEGHDVWGVDVDAAKVGELRAGRSPVAEPGLAELVAAGGGGWRAARHDVLRDALDRADVSLVCVGTPSAARGGTDLSSCGRSVNDIVAACTGTPPASGHHSVVIRSTVPPGTVEDVVSPALADGLATAPTAVGAAMCPEFLREGSGVADFLPRRSWSSGRPTRASPTTVTRLFSFLGQPARIVGRPDGRGAQVRVQRIPRHQGLLRQ